MDSQPVNLKLCLYGGKEATIEKSFDKTTTVDGLQQEIRRLFNINTDRETKLWINSTVYSFKPNANSKSDELSASSQSDAKENNSSLSNDAIGTNNKTAVNSTSPIKPPPTPPPVQANLFNNSSSPINNNTSSPNVITRQAAQSMIKQIPIALPDSTSSPNSKLPSINWLTPPDSTQTLADAGVENSDVVTLEVINVDGTWPSLRPRFGHVNTRSSKAQPGLCGLSNMGNTCFMNAALQCLSNTPPLTHYILTDKFVDDINTSNPLSMHGEIARTYAELIKLMWSGNHTSFMPREFKCAVSRFAPQFSGFAQQDCQELMAFLLDGLHEDLNRIKNKPYIEVKNDIEKRPDEEVAQESWENYKKRNDSIVVDTFHAMLKSTLLCPECKMVSVTFDPFCYLSLPLPIKREKQVNLTFSTTTTRSNDSKIEFASSSPDPEAVKVVDATKKSDEGDEMTEVEMKLNGGSDPKTTTSSAPTTQPALDSSIFNSCGYQSSETSSPGKKECDPELKLYLGDTLPAGSVPQPESKRPIKNDPFESFVSKVSSKPTLQLQDCITQFTSAEKLGADDPWYCPKCKKHQQATKKFDIWSLPEVLIIHLKRFSFSRSWRDKIDTLVEFPVEKLDMSSYVHNPEQKKQGPMIYNLIGVANHFGGLGGGHYTAYAKNVENGWYSFDDALVSATSAHNVVTRSAYVLFYQREGTGREINSVELQTGVGKQNGDSAMQE